MRPWLTNDPSHSSPRKTTKKQGPHLPASCLCISCSIMQGCVQIPMPARGVKQQQGVAAAAAQLLVTQDAHNSPGVALVLQEQRRLACIHCSPRAEPDLLAAHLGAAPLFIGDTLALHSATILRRPGEDARAELEPR